MADDNRKPDVTIGCDLGDKKSEVCILGSDGAIERPKPVGTTRQEMTAFFTRPRAHVVIEAGTHSRWVSNVLKGLGHKVTVANPRKLSLISRNDSKNDRTDAELLARLGRADEKLLSPVVHRSDEAQAHLATAKVRDGLVACRTRLVNQARSLVKSFGYRLPKCTTDTFHKACWGSVPKELKQALAPAFGMLRHLEIELKRCNKAIARAAKKYPDVEIIGQPNGVGVLTALVFLLTIEDKTRFKSSRDVGAYVGLRPKMYQSGGTDPQLRITKAGDAYLRRLLVGSANYILGPFGKDSDLRRWGLQLAGRGGKNAQRRAKVAVARKLAVLMHRLWVTGEEYKPLGYGKKAEAPATVPTLTN